MDMGDRDARQGVRVAGTHHRTPSPRKPPHAREIRVLLRVSLVGVLRAGLDTGFRHPCTFPGGNLQERRGYLSRWSASNRLAAPAAGGQFFP